MIGTGCPVLPSGTGAHPLFHGFSPARVSLSPPAARSSISAAIVIVASVMAAFIAGRNPAAGSAVKPTAAINKVPKGASTIATASEPTASGGAQEAEEGRKPHAH
jgi:hypothetical protein